MVGLKKGVSSVGDKRYQLERGKITSSYQMAEEETFRLKRGESR